MKVKVQYVDTHRWFIDADEVLIGTEKIEIFRYPVGEDPVREIVDGDKISAMYIDGEMVI